MEALKPFEILTMFCQNLEAAIFQAIASFIISFPLITMYIAVNMTPITFEGIRFSELAPGRPPSSRYVSHT